MAVSDSHVPAVMSLQGDGSSSSESQNGCGYNDDGSAYTLNGRDKQAVAFAQNTRDEVRLFGGDGQTVGALSAQPGMKQTSYVCMQDGQSKGTICDDGTSTTLNASHEQPIVCAADDNGKTAVEDDLCGSLKVGGGVALNSNGEMVVGTLCARDWKGVGNEYVGEGKVICQKFTC